MGAIGQNREIEQLKTLLFEQEAERLQALENYGILNSEIHAPIYDFIW